MQAATLLCHMLATTVVVDPKFLAPPTLSQDDILVFGSFVNDSCSLSREYIADHILLVPVEEVET